MGETTPLRRRCQRRDSGGSAAAVRGTGGTHHCCPWPDDRL